MAQDPIANDCRKLPNLEIDSRVLSEFAAEEIFVQPDLSTLVAWIEATVDARLGKDIDMGADLSVKKQSQTRVKKNVVVGKDEAGCGRLDEVGLKIDQHAYTQ